MILVTIHRAYGEAELYLADGYALEEAFAGRLQIVLDGAGPAFATADGTWWRRTPGCRYVFLLAQADGLDLREVPDATNGEDPPRD